MAVRRETVVLELKDDFSTPAARAAAQATLLDRNLDHLVGVAGRSSASMRRLGPDATAAAAGFRRAGADIDMFSDRLKLMAQAGAALGPALVPAIGGLTPAVTGLASGMAGAAGAAAAVGLAFAGVGDALGALNDFQLEPSTENFQELQQAMDELGPAGEGFVRHLDSIGGELERLQRIAGSEMFPGMTAGLQSLMGLMPRVQDLIGDLSARMGDLAADAGEALAGEEWEAFFAFLKSDAAPIFEDFSRAAGNVALGLGNLMVAFAPLSRDFASGLLEVSRAFAAWSADSSNFEEFIDYVQSVGPQAIEFFVALGEASVALVQAVAPWGSVVLPALTAALNVFTAIADSPIGPALTTAALAMLTFNKAAAGGSAIMGRFGPMVGGMGASFGQMRTDLGTVATTWATAGAATERESKKMAAATGRLKGNLASIGKGAGALGAIGIAASGAAQGVGLQNAAMLGLAGTMVGPWGAAAGAGVGLILDFKAAQDQAAASASELAGLLDQQTGAMTRNYTAAVAAKMKPEDLSVLREAGVNVGDMTTALLEGGDAWSRFRAEMDASGLQESDWSLFGLGSSRGDAGEAIKNMDNLAVLVGASKDAFREQKPAVDAAAGSVANAARATAELTAAQRAQNQATLASIDAGTRWGEAIANAAKQAQSGTKGFNHLTEAGRANRTAMSQLVGAYNAQSDSVKNSAKGYESARGRIAELGAQMGLTRERIQQLQAALDKPSKVKVDGKQALQTADSIRERIGKIPKDPTSKAHLKDQASDKIASILQRLQSLDGKTANTTITTTHVMRTVEQTAAINRERANGGFQENGRLAFADGGYGMDGRYYSRQPMLIPGGANILWGEKETGWEAYISGKPSERDRNLEILGMAADRLGAMVLPAAAGRITAYANGGGVRGGRSTTGSLERALRSLEKSVDKSRERVDYWNGKRSEVRSAVSGSLERNWFEGGSTDPWSDGLTGGTVAFAEQQWRQQIADSNALTANIVNLRKRGAGDAFIAEILRSEDPLAAARMFNQSNFKTSEKLFRSATRATAAAANSTSSIYADEQRRTTAVLERMEKRVAGLEKAINRNHRDAQDSRDRNSPRKAAARGSRSQKR